MELLVLDSMIGTWVLLPIVLLVLLCSLLRQKLMDTSPKTDTQPDMQQQFVSSVILRSQLLRGPGLWLFAPRSFFCRQQLLLGSRGGQHHQQQGLLWLAPEASAVRSLENFAKQDPSVAFSAMKSQLAFIILQGGMAYLINTFFSGFVVAKTPISLPYRFKAMLQRGVDVPLLQVNYVSSLSWYFLVMLSIGGLFFLLNSIFTSSSSFSAGGSEGDAFQDNANAALTAALGMPPGGPAALMPGMGGPEPKKLFKQERDSLQVAQPTDAIFQMPKRLLQEWNLSC
ncbi:ER membrane protein complex subunit 3-like [Cyclospora cayetanensis]|uniref:ER membrane protein complex subunit 3 n=1 Tax=Cyclospora cayetanensis TaxID=88456 RepID=A0A6P6S161_9EIME|nr:ER membrane protein complex subunit 3-like [Cyclospora cayetanensis]